jgi:hypothetical protein
VFSIRTDEKTDTVKPTVALRNFANAPKTNNQSSSAVVGDLFVILDVLVAIILSDILLLS